MQPIGIVTDSHSGITHKMEKALGILVLPLPFYVGEECCYEGMAGEVIDGEKVPSITREDFFQQLAAGVSVSTSQPSPASVMEWWDKALKEYEKILYLPISSGLSGSCQTAMMLSREDEYDGKVFVVDNGRVSAPLHRSVLDALELIKDGYSAEEIKDKLEAARADMVIYVTVEDLGYLKRGGRISGAAASLGAVLNIKPILKFDVGTLDAYKKCRGMKKARAEMLEALKNDLETKFKEAYEKDEVHILAASSADAETTESWINEIKEYFPGKEVLYGDLPMGLTCHIGPGGLGIACSCAVK